MFEMFDQLAEAAAGFAFAFLLVGCVPGLMVGFLVGVIVGRKSKAAGSSKD